MKQKLVSLVVLVIFVLTGCKSINRFSAVELERKIMDFEQSSEQFSYESSIKITVSNGSREDTQSETLSGRFNRDLTYIEEIVNGGTRITIKKDTFTQVIEMHESNVMDGLQFYTETIIRDEIDPEIGIVRINPNRVKLTKSKDNVFTITGSLKDFISEQELEELKVLYDSLNLDGDALEDSKIIVTMAFEDSSMVTTFDFELAMDDIKAKVEIRIETNQITFEEINIEDTSKYRLAFKNEGSVSIDINEPILFKYNQYATVKYEAFFEPGKYTYQSNAVEDNLLFYVNIFSDDAHRIPLRVIDEDILDYYNPYYRFFEIKEAGYYPIEIDYTVPNYEYQTQFTKLEYETDGFVEIDYSIQTSQEIEYEIEHIYDFISIEVPGNEETFVRITHDEHVSFLAHKGTIPNQSIGLTSSYVVLKEERVFYMYSKSGATSGTISIEVQPLTQAQSKDDPNIKTLDENFSDPLITSNKQVMKIEIATLNRIQFDFDIIIDSGNPIQYRITNSAGKILYTKNNQITLLPGTYYYESTNYSGLLMYRIRLVDLEEDITLIETTLSPYNQLYGDYVEANHRKGKYVRDTEWIMYHFELTKITDVAFEDYNNQWLLNDRFEKVHIDGLFDLMSYRLNPGHYYAATFFPPEMSQANLPLNYTLEIFEFTGGKYDDSVYPNFKTLSIPLYYESFNRNYPNDFDGLNFILTEATTVSLMSSDWGAVLLKNGVTIYNNFETKTVLLQPGVYTFMCKTDDDKWTAIVSIVT